MAIYHLRAKTGSRSGGQSARAKVDYLSRGGRYDKSGDRVLHIESGNMPAWALAGRSERAQLAAAAYWSAADAHERANGRLFKHLQIALPRELALDEQVELVRRFAQRCASVPGGSLPFTFTLHEGKGENPHADVILSERVNDGHERSPALWFKRAAASTKGKPIDPATGGAAKTDHLKPEAWLLWAREAWANYQNEALADAEKSARVDHRSLADQAVDRAPTRHLGPQALAIEQRTAKPSRRRQYLEETQRLERELADALQARKRAQGALDEEMEAQRAQQVRRRVEAYGGVRLADSSRYAWWVERRTQLLEAWYGEVQSSSIARSWRVSRRGDALVFERPADRARVVDVGPQISAATGSDVEISLMVEAVKMKQAAGTWSGPVVITGDDDFRARATMAFIAAGIDVADDESPPSRPRPG